MPDGEVAEVQGVLEGEQPRLRPILRREAEPDGPLLQRLKVVVEQREVDRVRERVLQVRCRSGRAGTFRGATIRAACPGSTV